MRKIWVNGVFVAAFLLVSPSCRKHEDKRSEVRWPVDFLNDPRNFDTPDQLTYDDLIKTTTVDTGMVPWTDTYWPYVNQGSSLRWARFPVPPRDLSQPTDETDNADQWPKQLGLAAFIASHFSELQRNEPERLIYLSPAEKHDIVLRHLNGISLDQATVNSEIAALATVEAGIDSSTDRKDKKKAASLLRQRLAHTQSRPLSKLLPLSLKGFDTWLYNAAIPSYQFGSEELGEEEEKLSNWDWMGHCHGWAPASILEEAPRHAVMVKAGDQSVLFTEGDIRGLMTKAWADNPIQGKTQFLGRRCSENTDDLEASLPVDPAGRVYDGEMVSSLHSSKALFHSLSEIYRYNVKLQRLMPLYTMYLPESGETLYVVDPQKNNESPLVFRSLLKVNRYMQNADASLGVKAKLKFYGCRDVNPAALHTILHSYLGKTTDPEAKPFRLVMDRTKSGQVWNQPVYRADFRVGELRDIDDIPNDPLARYRAGGTQYLAEVVTKIYWTAEPYRPQWHYEADFDAAHAERPITVYYTLEFDEDKTLIGGEWGHIGDGEYKGYAPDFLWTYAPGAKPGDTWQVNYSKVISPIHKCSLSDNPDKTMTIGDQVIKYSECALGE